MSSNPFSIQKIQEMLASGKDPMKAMEAMMAFQFAQRVEKAKKSGGKYCNTCGTSKERANQRYGLSKCKLCKKRYCDNKPCTDNNYTRCGGSYTETEDGCKNHDTDDYICANCIDIYDKHYPESFYCENLYGPQTNSGENTLYCSIDCLKAEGLEESECSCGKECAVNKKIHQIVEEEKKKEAEKKKEEEVAESSNTSSPKPDRKRKLDEVEQVENKKQKKEHSKEKVVEVEKK